MFFKYCKSLKKITFFGCFVYFVSTYFKIQQPFIVQEVVNKLLFWLFLINKNLLSDYKIYKLTSCCNVEHTWSEITKHQN